MSEHYNMLLVAWLFILLIGGWLLVNALIDLGARRVRDWLSARGITPRWSGHAEEPATPATAERRDSSTQPITQ